MSTQSGTATGWIDLINKFNTFVTATGHAWGLTFSGTGTGRLTAYIGVSASVVETVTVTATTSTSFTVVGSVTGSLGTATVGTQYTGSRCAFLIVAGATAFIAGDQFKFSLSTKWTQKRLAGISEIAQRTGSMTSVQNVFDFNQNTYVQLTAFPAWVQIECQWVSAVKAVSVQCYDADNGPSAFTVQWSDDGSTWTTALTVTGQTGWLSRETRYYQLSSPPTKKYWRINITAAQSGTLQLADAHFYGDAAGTWALDQRAEFAWTAPGVDGAQEIWVAGYTYSNSGTDQWNIVFKGFRYWSTYSTDTSVLSVAPVAPYLAAMALSKNNFQYWMIVHGGRAIIAVRISGQYLFLYLGFGLPYETPANHAYPMLIGGQNNQATSLSDVTDYFRNPSDPGGGGLQAIQPDGSWKPYGNRGGGNGSEGNNYGSAYDHGVTWPYANDASGTQNNQLRENIDGTMPLLPVILIRESPKHIWGEFDGVYWTTGFGNAAEALLRDGAIDVLVFPNIFRTAINSYCGLALD